MRTSAERDNASIAETITITEGCECGNDVTVTIQVTQPTGRLNPDHFPPMVAYLATAAAGLVLEPASGGVAAGSRGTVGTLLTDDSVFTITPDDNGFVDVVVTQTGCDAIFLVVIDPEDGSKIASGQLDFTT